jgi:hypothetical protein
MRAYDPKDFAANPLKYQLFKTATIAKHVHTNNGEHDLPQGAIVGIAYRFNALNPLYRRREPIYTIVGTDRDLYANCLADFVL